MNVGTNERYVRMVKSNNPTEIKEMTELGKKAFWEGNL